MERVLSAKEVALGAGILRPTLDAWIARGWFRPRLDPDPGQGKRRRYSEDDAVRLAAMAELGRLGVPLAHAGEAASAASALHPNMVNGNSVLVVWEGPVAWSRPGQQDHETMPGGWKRIFDDARRHWDPDRPHFQWDVVPPDAVSAMILDPDKRALAAVHMERCERQVLARLLGKNEWQAQIRRYTPDQIAAMPDEADGDG